MTPYQPSPPPPASVLDRVKKLLALTESPNEHEAETAALLAAKIMGLHQITEGMLGGADAATDAPAVDEEPLESLRRPELWRTRLAAAVAAANGCAVLERRCRSRAMVAGGTAPVALHVAGRQGDVATARYLYAYLARAVDGLAATQRASGRRPAWVTQYRLGVVDTLMLRLEQGRADARESTRRAAAAGRLPAGVAEAERAIVRADTRRQEAMAAATTGTSTVRTLAREGEAREWEGRVSGRIAGGGVALGPSSGGLAAPAAGAIGEGE